jgi:hypothetical protein
VDEHLMCGLPAGGQLSSAAIVGHDGGVWAQSAGFPAISKTEVEALLRGLSDPSTLAMTGIVIGGEKVRPSPRALPPLRRAGRNKPALPCRPLPRRAPRSSSPSAASPAA